MELNEKFVMFCAGLTIIPLFLKCYLKRTYKCLEEPKPTNEYNYRTIFINYTNNTCKIHVYRKTACSETCSYAHLKNIVKLINEARRSISICVCIVTCIEIQDSLMDAQKRGIKVRLISDYEMLQGDAARVPEFVAAGVEIKTQSCLTNSLLHHKFFLIDEYQPTALLFTGSLNLTCQGLTCNWENVIITDDLNVIQSFREEFERLWNTFNIYNRVSNFKKNKLQNKA